jgi:hypothetical protein
MSVSLRVGLPIATVLFLFSAIPVEAQDALGRGKDLLKGLTSGSKSASGLSGLTSGEMAGGLRDALRVGSERVVSTLGKADGFNKASDIHIPLPGSLKTVQSMLAKAGMSGLADDLELKLNRAAESAVPQAKVLFSDAIAQMSIDDAAKIVNGPKDSATQYFREKMSAPLAASMKPIVDGQLANVGAVAAFDKMMGQYKSLPLAPKAQANLTEYVVEKAIGGVFLYLGREEAAIRENPAKRTTELLQKVFNR